MQFHLCWSCRLGPFPQPCTTPPPPFLSLKHTHARSHSPTRRPAPHPTGTPDPSSSMQVHPSQHISGRSHHAIKTRRRMRRQANLFPAWSYITLAGRLYPWAKSKFTQRERVAGQRGSGVSTFQMAADMNPADWQVWQKGAWWPEEWSQGCSFFFSCFSCFFFCKKQNYKKYIYTYVYM